MDTLKAGKNYPDTKEFVNLAEEILEELKLEIINSPSGNSVADESWIDACDVLLYGISCSVTAFEEHIKIWYGAVMQNESDREYVNAIEEIVKLIDEALEDE